MPDTNVDPVSDSDHVTSLGCGLVEAESVTIFPCRSAEDRLGLAHLSSAIDPSCGPWKCGEWVLEVLDGLDQDGSEYSESGFGSFVAMSWWILFLVDDSLAYQFLIKATLRFVSIADQAWIPIGLDPVINELLRLFQSLASSVYEVVYLHLTPSIGYSFRN